MTIFQILILAIVQGAAELLPVSSSAHVIVFAKLMGLDPTTPEMTLLLVMLHTGTMFAVIIYFWKSWKINFFGSMSRLTSTIKLVMVATVLTGVVGIVLKTLIEKFAMRTFPHAEIELLFGNLDLIAVALTIAGILIIFAGLRGRHSHTSSQLGIREASLIGIIQGLCLPFRGFSRSGATISTGLMLGVAREKAEEFSFVLAVVLTPPVIAREVMRLLKSHALSATALGSQLTSLLLPSLLGMILSFFAGLMALRWLSSWLEKGRWHFFGYYCLGAAAIIFGLYQIGI